MNRTEELNALLNEAPPAGLEGTIDRAKRRRAKRRGTFLGLPIASLAGAAAAFVLLVNTSVPFALACGQIPFLKPLVAAAARSDTLKAALKNDYYQVLGDSYTENGVTLTLSCAVVDDRQVNLFLSVDRGQGSDVKVMDAQGKELNWGGVLYSFDAQPGELSYFTMDFIKAEPPRELTIAYTVSEGKKELATFRFPLTLDERYFGTAQTHELGQWIELDGQRLRLDRLVVSPTYMQLDLSDDEDNSAWLTGLSFYLEDERGRRYDRGSASPTVGGEDGTPFLPHYRAGSSYFSGGEHLTLHVAAARWLDKDHTEVTMDLKHQTAVGMPKYVVSWSAARDLSGHEEAPAFDVDPEKDWTLILEVAGNYHSLPFFSYNSPYEFSNTAWRASDGDPETPTTTFLTLVDCPEEVVTLPLSYSRLEEYDSEVVLELF